MEARDGQKQEDDKRQLPLHTSIIRQRSVEAIDGGDNFRTGSDLFAGEARVVSSIARGCDRTPGLFTP